MTYGDVTSSRTVRRVHENERIMCSVVFEVELKSNSMRSEHAFTLTTRSLVASRATVSELLEFLLWDHNAGLFGLRARGGIPCSTGRSSVTGHTHEGQQLESHLAVWHQAVSCCWLVTGLTNHPEEKERRVGDLWKAACPDLTHCLMWRLL